MAEQNPGTEYTLQGVMRFLQIEWHNHERARNAWDIERAEMKAKIAKQEGDCRSSRKLTETLDRQVRMLEKALKQERGKNKAATTTESPPPPPPPPVEEEVKKEWSENMGIKPKTQTEPSKTQELDQDNEHDHQSQAEPHREAQRDKSKAFLEQCVNELSYLLQPPSHPPVPQPNPSMHNGSAEYPPDIPSSMAEAYMQQQQQQQQHPQQQQQPRRNVQPGLSHLPSLPNNHNPSTSSSRSQTEYYQPTHQYQHQGMPRQPPHQMQPPDTIELSPSDNYEQQHEPLTIRNPDDEVEERITHSFDSHGRQIQGSSDDFGSTGQLIPDDANGWNFDDSNTILETPSDLPTQRLDADSFPNNATNLPAKSPPRTGFGHRRKSSSNSGSHRRRNDGSYEIRELSSGHGAKGEPSNFKVRFALRGHLDVVRSAIFTGGGSPSEPEICTAGDDGTVKRWIIPASYSSPGNQKNPSQPSTGNDLDIQSYFTHRGHDGVATCLASCPASPSFSTGGRALGDGWIFSGGQDATIRVWERGRVDPKATLDGHTDAVWTVCVLPGTMSSVFGQENSTSTSSTNSDSPNATHTSPNSSSAISQQMATARDDRILLASGAADGTVKIWAIIAPPQLFSPSQNSSGTNRRGVGGSRRHSVTSGSGFPSSPQPSMASGTPFHYSLIHSMDMHTGSPTCISPLGAGGETFVVAYADASTLIFDTRSGEQVAVMASQETFDGTANTAINSVVVAAAGAGTETGGSVGGSLSDSARANAPGSGCGDEGESLGATTAMPHGATGNSREGGIEGTVITGHEDRFVRFFDANSGQCTYSMLAHPSSISSLSLSPDGRELVSAGHDASLRFWSLEKRSCVQEVTSHRVCRGEGVVCAVWSFDGRWVVSAGGDGVVKVFGR